eukprot:309993-Amphidinium_carterae.2
MLGSLFPFHQWCHFQHSAARLWDNAGFDIIFPFAFGQRQLQLHLGFIHDTTLQHSSSLKCVISVSTQLMAQCKLLDNHVQTTLSMHHNILVSTHSLH